jgi:hypothetical protein
MHLAPGQTLAICRCSVAASNQEPDIFSILFFTELISFFSFSQVKNPTPDADRGS